MIGFDDITKRTIGYALFYQYVRFVHHYIFYRRFYVLHRENIPKDVPVIAVSNHQNGLSDALGILFAFGKDGRRPVFFARSDIFNRNFIAKLLRFIRVMPAFRAADAGKERLYKNEAVFDRAARVLTENEVVCLFPEAGHEDCHHLGAFKKGFARIAFRAAEMMHFEKPVYVLPVSVHYSNYFAIRHKLIVIFGKPFAFEDLYGVYREHPQRAQKILTDSAREKVKGLMLDIENKSLYNEYDTIRMVYDKEYVRKRGRSVSWFPNLLEADRNIVAALDRMRKADPPQFRILMGQARAYSRLLEKLHLDDWIFSRRITFCGFVLRCLSVVLLLPLMIYGFVHNVVPFNASTLVTRHVKDQMLHSSFHFGIGVVIAFPLWYLLLFVSAWGVTGRWWVAVLYLVTLPVSLLIYIHSKVLVKKMFNRFRRIRFWFRGDRFYLRAVELRRKIVRTISSLTDFHIDTNI